LLVLDELAFLLDERVGVLREARAEGEQQVLVVGRALEQGLERLQAEGDGVPYELRIVVGGKSGALASQGVRRDVGRNAGAGGRREECGQ